MNTHFKVLMAFIFLSTVSPFSAQAQTGMDLSGGYRTVEPTTEEEFINALESAKDEKVSLNKKIEATKKEYHDTLEAKQKELLQKRAELKLQKKIQTDNPDGTNKYFNSVTRARALDNEIESLTDKITSLRSDFKSDWENYNKQFDYQRSVENEYGRKLWAVGPKSAKGKAMSVAPDDYKKMKEALAKSEAARKSSEAGEANKLANLSDLDDKYQKQLKTIDSLTAKLKEVRAQLKAARKSASACTNPTENPVQSTRTELKELKAVSAGLPLNHQVDTPATLPGIPAKQ